ncbi:cytochrome b [Caldovatus aquaticus]|uniref:Cytochrome b/b6 domain-containing protein n=1 Tax=Caldovatus aquaticus TaxID=2865671 RepID=A0ABS7F656_9PROT|nr:cytochrome b/b6 domain-containing protein [Caldovatus aquaticus]MBW8270291.1 cytochrome b/b6 domain-containing protein [Caldovatus aquaticus]
MDASEPARAASAAATGRAGTAARYTALARALHWLTAALILVVAVLGIWIVFFEPADTAFKLRLYNIHESTGLLIFALAVLRLLWRAGHPPPPITPPLPPLMALAAHLNHALLYAILLVQPIVGFLATNAWGFPLRWFGLFPVPSPIGKDEAIAPVLSAIHFGLAIALGALLLAHVAAALFHHLVRKDDTLRRML